MTRAVEFCGIPGSGKSTLAQALLTQARLASLSIGDSNQANTIARQLFAGRTAVTTGIRSIPHSLAHPVWLLGALRYAILRRRRHFDVARRLLRTQNKLRTVASHHHATNTFILDEWLVHELWLSAMGDSSRTMVPDNVWRRVADVLSKRDWRFVFVDCSVDEAIHRIATRHTDSPLNSLQMRILRQLLNASKDESWRLTSVIAARARLPVLVLNGHVSIEQNLALLEPVLFR
jgi:hypothetical protein